MVSGPPGSPDVLTGPDPQKLAYCMVIVLVAYKKASPILAFVFRIDHRPPFYFSKYLVTSEMLSPMEVVIYVTVTCKVGPLKLLERLCLLNAKELTFPCLN